MRDETTTTHTTDDAPFCLMCAHLAGEAVLATQTRPEPPRGAFSCVPGTFPSGVDLCDECAEAWDSAAPPDTD